MPTTQNPTTDTDDYTSENTFSNKAKTLTYLLSKSPLYSGFTQKTNLFIANHNRHRCGEIESAREGEEIDTMRVK
jgi:hypothetical protein